MWVVRVADLRRGQDAELGEGCNTRPGALTDSRAYKGNTYSCIQFEGFDLIQYLYQKPGSSREYNRVLL